MHTAGCGSGILTATGRRHSRRWQRYLTSDPIAASPGRRFAVSLINIVLIVALFVAVTPTEVRAGTCAPVFWYYHGDHLGGSNVMTDRSGALVDHYEYYAFGKEKHNDPTCSFNVSNRYTGQILDEDTGLYYYNARYYDPELGRFIQADSIVPSAGDPQTLNRYSYVNNNPLKYTDPSGHFAFLAPILGALLTTGAVGAAIGAGLAAARGANLTQGAFAGLFVGGWAGLAPDNVQKIIIQVGQAALSVAAIVVGAMLIASGVGAPAGGWLIAQGVLTIASGGLSLASQGAGSAGDPRLSQTLGYAALAAGAAAMVVGIAHAVVSDHTPSGDERALGGETNSPLKTVDAPEGMSGTGKAKTAVAFGSWDAYETPMPLKVGEIEALTKGANAGQFDIYWRATLQDLETINAKYSTVVYFGHGNPVGSTTMRGVQIPGTYLRGGKGMLVDLTSIKGFSNVKYTCYQCNSRLWLNAGVKNIKAPLAGGTPQDIFGGPAIRNFLSKY